VKHVLHTAAGKSSGAAQTTGSSSTATAPRFVTSHRTKRVATSRARAVSRARTVRAHVRASKGSRNATDVVAATSAASHAATPARHQPAANRRHRGGRHAAAAKAKRKRTPISRIQSAAVQVIEVIPPAVSLVLLGLLGLLIVVIVRSWATERRRAKALVASYGVTVEALAVAIEAKDQTTGGHIERVRLLGLLLAREVAPREARDPQMAYGFLLHDIGKLAVPDAILRSPGRLSEQEWAAMRRHPDEGVRMLAHVPFLDRALDVVRHHHERWDGGGYPAGLSGTEIPLWARIFSVVDALDAMTAERPYQAARSYPDALDEIRRNAGTQFDPAVVEALERIDPDEIQPLLEAAPLVKPLAELPGQQLVAV
jgi:HD-GYP domain-containing protein (c-di-GMP phosphodiesterase class II)